MIASLRAHIDLAATVAEWVYQEFAYSFGCSFADWLDLLCAQEGIQTFVALEAGVLLGTASLDVEDFPLRPDCSPWLASVVVRPEARSRGLGGRLLAHVELEAQAQGFQRLHLHTSEHEAFYVKRGWRTLERVALWGRLNALMVKDFGVKA